MLPKLSSWFIGSLQRLGTFDDHDHTISVIVLNFWTGIQKLDLEKI